MKRIENVFNEVKKAGEIGVTAKGLSQKMNLSRTNVSSDLNRLAAEGRLVKDDTKRPICFYAIQKKPEELETELDLFAKENPSLFGGIEQAKAAVLYPPHGMNIMILGETGVGKSMFAKLIHSYAIQMKRMESQAPFIVFNCADYSNNQQLLLAQVFGSKKGAYTGASEDRKGLLEEADNGIIFFDEVHRLPPEGQEMLFTFIDNGTFRRLGDGAQRTAHVLIIAATTEDPSSNLLATFVRRIPMVITIPCLSQRTIEERFNLVTTFFKNEATKLNKTIKVSVNSLKAFLSYSCPNNIGQLKSDVQLSCAKAYANYVSGKKDDIEVSSLDLQHYLRKGLYASTEHRVLWRKLIKVNHRLCVFDPAYDLKIIEEKPVSQNIYESIDSKIYELKEMGIPEEDIPKHIGANIKEYFSEYFEMIQTQSPNISNIIGDTAVNLASEILKYSEESLNRSFNEKIHYAITMHIANLIERIRSHKKIANKALNSIMKKYPLEFETAIDCLKIIERVLDITVPLDEAGFLCVFFLADEKKVIAKSQRVKIIVIAHGKSTATSMVDAVNTLLGIDYAVGINANLDESLEKVLEKLKSYVASMKTMMDILMLVDMGSLINFAEALESEFGMKVKTIPLVSTLHVLEATRKAIMFRTLEEIYKETLEVNDYTNAVILLADECLGEKPAQSVEKVKILTVCSTGEGTAVAIKDKLALQLEFNNAYFEIIPMNFMGSTDMIRELNKLEQSGKILCIVTNFDFQYTVPMFGIQDVFTDAGISEIQELIDIETTYIKLGDTLKNYVANIDVDSALKDSEEFIQELSQMTNKVFNKTRRIGMMMHIVCMMDRMQSNDYSITFDNMENYIAENNTLFNTVKQKCYTLNDKYNIRMPDAEICYIMKFFNNT